MLNSVKNTKQQVVTEHTLRPVTYITTAGSLNIGNTIYTYKITNTATDKNLQYYFNTIINCYPSNYVLLFIGLYSAV